MAKRTKEDALKTRNQLLDTAARLFCKNGVGKTSLEDIAKFAGVTRGAIYWHFKNKNDILEALWEEAGSPERAPDTERAKDHGADPLGYLRDRAIQTLQEAATDERTRQVWTLIFHKMELDSSPLIEHVETSRKNCRAGVVKLFAAAKEAGQIDDTINEELLTSAYFGYLDGLIYNWLRNTGEMNLAKNAQTLVDLLFRSLKNSTGSDI